MNGILLTDKPKDHTSFDVVAIVRGCVHERRAGHTGTLDPMATGVLPVLLGSATKAQALLPDTDKEYEAAFQLGITTDTLDITGTVLSRQDTDISMQQIEDILPQFRGDIMQLPPMYSAVSKYGVRLYELARKGIEAEREARPVHIGLLELTAFDASAQSGRLRISCSKGTYIRSICDDIGKALGCGCVMTELRRTKACGFDISEATPLSEIRRLAKEAPDSLAALIRPVESIFREYRAVKVSEKQAFRFRNGGSLMIERLRDINNIRDGEMFRIKDYSGGFIGLACADLSVNELKFKKLFNGES